MPQESYDLKLRAREQLKDRWLQAGIVSFIAWLLTIAFTEGNVNAIHSVQFIWLNGELISVPYTSTLTRLADLLSFILIGPITLGVSGYFLKLVRQEGPIIEDMFGGFKFFLKAFVLDLLMTIFIILWSLLLIIPGIIAALRYSMAYYIMIDNPQLSAFEALNQSKLMMVGFKSELFKFWLSYLGWFLLGVITLGIAFLWVTPYYETAKANFYQDLKDHL
ncbi:DUF975 family protein [Desulfosporosinus lacus]|uniref:Uncharacterized membrane protein n=1 Tax=Desulfosporosinus lacus DSM 15449 TaxID=1121420 RepID=A0A1M5XI52_9FIRM|nr:DUF975 family protein [Desulfosporosinus lacus]SHH99204.1 Uncharacterized membrane protein [Desulfosporosinus lacus DSM 15449]